MAPKASEVFSLDRQEARAVEPSNPLLTPSLTSDDDTGGMSPPWNPSHLVFITFFFGLLPGGALLALNFRRLGKPRRALVAGGVVLACSLLFVGLYAPALRAGIATALAGGDVSRQRELRWLIRGASVAVALVLARLQAPRYRLWTMTHVQGAPLFKPAAIAVLVGGGLELSLTAVAQGMVQP